ncbi:hypothetical protein E2C01_024958 [Portunus trituberculatus]|uniref:Uncharacterized protein n=1 Tax=Portunus trituberculatus TaxID=210409 RepID=A0A5B7EBY7_PORTR|nr:hypothetical protein [Portunus trituberculatus]
MWGEEWCESKEVCKMLLIHLIDSAWAVGGGVWFLRDGIPCLAAAEIVNLKLKRNRVRLVGLCRGERTRRAGSGVILKGARTPIDNDAPLPVSPCVCIYLLHVSPGNLLVRI